MTNDRIESEAGRDIGAELLEAIRDVKAGRVGAAYVVDANEVINTRLRTGLSQAQFAAALQISPRTLQQWEQGRRRPSGAADTLLKIIARHPEVVRDVAAGAYRGLPRAQWNQRPRVGRKA